MKLFKQQHQSSLSRIGHPCTTKLLMLVLLIMKSFNTLNLGLFLSIFNDKTFQMTE